MATYEGKSGQLYTTIEPCLGKGGEGAVYSIVRMPSFVLKVYAAGKATETRHRKLLAMLITKLPQYAMQQVTWPIDVVYQNGKFAGYVMPKLSGAEELNVMYSDKYRCTLSEKITIAKNLCAALNAIHEAGQVCGDLNPKNIGVDPRSAKVTLLDTDSYHIIDNNNIYRCEVGLPEYLAREVQEKIKNGKTLASVALPTFSRETDLFALAVHIFALLMNGCHPFACAVSSGNFNIGQLAASQPSIVAPQPIENICNGFFPFYEKRVNITTPRYAPKFEMLPTYIRDLFVKAFVGGNKNPIDRPNAVVWYQALSRMQQDLKVCSKDRLHMYPSFLSSCPWCEVDQKMKVIVPKVTLRPQPMPQVRQAPPTNTTNTYQGNSHRQTTVNTRNQGSAGKKVVWAIIAIIVVVFIINGISKNNNGYSNDYDYGNNLPDETYENISDNTNYESSDDYYILPYSNESYISEEDLTDLSQQEVSLARNEIYARHGRKFSTPEIHDYFMEQPWYTEIYEPEEFDSMANEVFNEYEKENVKTIINYEEKMGYR